jgi:glutathione S-transferase
MNDLTPILHHYALSPFSEKVRKALAYKRLPWCSVQTPAYLPKPDLMPLTGGYRKAPVLQLGRDIYCDSKLICRALDRLGPERPLIPPGQEAATLMIERWVDQHLFWAVVALVFQPQGLAALGASNPPGFVEALMKDRMAMFAQGGTQAMPNLEIARAELPGILGALEAQLAAQPYLGGAAPTQIDFAIYHPLWFLDGNAAVRGELAAYPRLCAWLQGLSGLGDGLRTELEGAAAVEFARHTQTEQAALPGAPLRLVQAQLGDTVKIAPSDYAPDFVQGELVIANAHELAIRRQDARAGTVVVHFPPEGFSVLRA